MSGTRYRRDLARDVASLVAKYGLTELAAFIDALKGPDVLDQLAELIAKLEPRVDEQRSRRPSSRPRITAKHVGPKSAEVFAALRNQDPKVADALNAFQARLAARTSFATAPELKSFWGSLGRKDPMPRERRSAVRQIVVHLARTPIDQLGRFLEDLQRMESAPTTSSYREWAATIMGSSQKGLRKAGVDPPPAVDLSAERENR